MREGGGVGVWIDKPDSVEKEMGCIGDGCSVSVCPSSMLGIGECFKCVPGGLLTAGKILAGCGQPPRMFLNR